MRTIFPNVYSQFDLNINFNYQQQHQKNFKCEISKKIYKFIDFENKILKNKSLI